MCASSITGTRSSPSFLAASTRPCPAMMPFAPSTSTGFVQPNSRMLAAICATWASEWVRGLRAYGISSPSGRQAICRSSIVQNLTNGSRIEVLLRAGIQRIPPQSAPDTPLPNFAGTHSAPARPVPVRPSWQTNGGPLPLGALAVGCAQPQRPSRAVLASWQGLHSGSPVASRPRTAPGRRGAARRGRPRSPARAVPARRARDAQRVAREVRGAAPGASGDRSLGALRSGAAGPAPRFTAAALFAPGGRCTGGFEGNGDSATTKPAAAMPGGLSFTRGRRAGRPDLV